MVKINEMYVTEVFNELQKDGFSFKYPPELYVKLKKQGKLKITKEQSIQLYQEQCNKYLNFLENKKLKEVSDKFELTYLDHLTEIQMKEKLKKYEQVLDVQESCRNILISNYLKDLTFEQLKEELKPT